jgi:hypothetical protein
MEDFKIYSLLCCLFFLIGLIISNIGSYSNKLVIESNGNRMPAYTKEIKYIDSARILSDEYFIFSNPKDINYPHLADIFTTESGIKSIGDYFLEFGVIFALTAFIFSLLIIYELGINLNLNKNS